MKKLIVVCVFITLAGCSNKIDRTALYGYVNINLPNIKGMTECATHPNIQLMVQQYLSAGPVLGYYLNNETYKQIEQIKPGETSFSDYFMIYGDYLRENYHAVKSDLELMEKSLEQTLFEGTTYEQISSKIEEVYGAITPGRPALIEKYSPRDNVLAMIVLIKYKSGTQETSVLSAVNCILLKNRLITMAYYSTYNGGQSIEALKGKNNEAIGKLMEAN